MNTIQTPYASPINFGSKKTKQNWRKARQLFPPEVCENLTPGSNLAKAVRQAEQSHSPRRKSVQSIIRNLVPALKNWGNKATQQGQSVYSAYVIGIPPGKSKEERMALITYTEEPHALTFQVSPHQDYFVQVDGRSGKIKEITNRSLPATTPTETEVREGVYKIIRTLAHIKLTDHANYFDGSDIDITGLQKTQAAAN